ncbi:tetratricopeptide repeat protein [Phytohabitans aurantiacus]|uniref:tetratricopeptide repeat protein n=1 Tax=Phytohabitans aurantiacus TaxID=3016789 RepID=UPI00249368B1|nr:tetratricopeptide repeat protein [Phytohabitans aurantiacus]
MQAGAIHGGVHYHEPAANNHPRPRQLPAEPTRWVDREDELTELDTALGDLGQRRPVLVLTGLGGVGKSALALRWGHRHRPIFPDGQLYTDLGAASPSGPLPSGEVLGRFLRALGVPPRAVPVDEGELAGLWRTLSADRRLLILLDNAASAAQVRPLLPTGVDSVVVVTARTLLDGLAVDGARFTPVQPLPEPAAVALLELTVADRRVIDEHDALHTLARLCSGMPIALGVVGSRLAIHPRRPVRRLVDSLTDQRHRLDHLSIGDISVTAAFDLSYKALSDTAARCYRLVVGLHPGAEFTTALAGAALDLPGHRISTVLDELVLASLISEVAEDRYLYHDLVGVHARRQVADDPEKDQARQRILTSYLAAAHTADTILTPYRRRPKIHVSPLPPDAVVRMTGRDQALDWLESERPTLVAAVRVMCDTYPALVYTLVDAMWPLFHFGRHHPDRMVVDEVALDCARRIGNPAFEAAALRRWGLAHYDIGQLDNAASLFQDSLLIAARVDGLQHIRAGAFAGLGLVALAAQDPQTAIRYFTRELETCTKAQDTRGIGLAQIRLGRAHRLAGHRSAAITHLTKAHTILAELADIDPYNGALARIELGRALADNGRPEDGCTQIEHGLREMTELRSPRGRAQALHALGEMAAGAGASSNAVHYLTEAQHLYESVGDAEVADVRRLLQKI